MFFADSSHLRPLLGCAGLVLLAGACSPPEPFASIVRADSQGTAEPAEAIVCGEFFDDFDYHDVEDPLLTEHGWYVRAYGGGPGVEGATWGKENVSFVEEDGGSLLRLNAVTDGTSQGTVQAEIGTSEHKFFEGPRPRGSASQTRL